MKRRERCKFEQSKKEEVQERERGKVGDPLSVHYIIFFLYLKSDRGVLGLSGKREDAL